MEGWNQLRTWDFCRVLCGNKNLQWQPPCCSVSSPSTSSSSSPAFSIFQNFPLAVFLSSCPWLQNHDCPRIIKTLSFHLFSSFLSSIVDSDRARRHRSHDNLSCSWSRSERPMWRLAFRIITSPSLWSRPRHFISSLFVLASLIVFTAGWITFSSSPPLYYSRCIFLNYTLLPVSNASDGESRSALMCVCVCVLVGSGKLNSSHCHYFNHTAINESDWKDSLSLVGCFFILFIT